MANAIYANGRAKALENSLLGIDRLTRMLDSGDAAEALKILSEVNFGDGLQIESPLDFEKLISVEESKLISFVVSTSASVEFKKFFLAKYDFHNAEAFIKSKYTKIETENLLSPNGLIDKDLLKDKILVDEYGSFDKELADALIMSDAEFVSGKATGASINAIFKKQLYKYLNIQAKKCKELKELYNVKADCQNVGVALRVRNFAEAEKYFVEGGKITATELKDLCEEQFDVLLEKTKFFAQSEFIAVALESAKNNSPLSEFERLSDSYSVDFLNKNKYQTTGIHPFMLYCYYKQNELANVRIILVGLINGLDRESIKRRLRSSYER